MTKPYCSNPWHTCYVTYHGIYKKTLTNYWNFLRDWTCCVINTDSFFSKITFEILWLPDTVVFAVTDTCEGTLGSTVISGDSVGVSTLNGNIISIDTDDIESVIFIDTSGEIHAFSQGRLARFIFDTLIGRFWER